ncbi:hypothetical protein ZWY2020_037445 [Hordeum vulgare]|nr:hypothetical protein ZWY2020_037445 [Hordeum vulgare]
MTVARRRARWQHLKAIIACLTTPMPQTDAVTRRPKSSIFFLLGDRRRAHTPTVLPRRAQRESTCLAGRADAVLSPLPPLHSPRSHSRPHLPPDANDTAALGGYAITSPAIDFVLHTPTALITHQRDQRGDPAAWSSAFSRRDKPPPRRHVVNKNARSKRARPDGLEAGAREAQLDGCPPSMGKVSRHGSSAPPRPPACSLSSRRLSSSLAAVAAPHSPRLTTPPKNLFQRTYHRRRSRLCDCEPERNLTAMGSETFVEILLAILLPPVGVFLRYGIGMEFWICLLLTLLGYIPGIIYAIFVLVA